MHFCDNFFYQNRQGENISKFQSEFILDARLNLVKCSASIKCEGNDYFDWNKNGGNGNIMNKRVLSTIRVQEYYLFLRNML